MGEPSMFIGRGAVVSAQDGILTAQIGTCACICFYHSGSAIGVLCHIDRCREDDLTPSMRFLKFGGFHYADLAVTQAVKMIRRHVPGAGEEQIQYVLCGGQDNEGPIRETQEVLAGHDFLRIGHDLNRHLHRTIRFDIARKEVTVTRNSPFISGDTSDSRFFRFRNTA